MNFTLLEAVNDQIWGWNYFNFSVDWEEEQMKLQIFHVT